MEICDEQTTCLCFKVSPPVFDKFSIIYYKEASVTLLWNKYEVLQYEGEDYSSEPQRFLPDFVIRNVMLTDNHLFCLDDNGTVYATRLRSKNEKKRPKSSFMPQTKNISHIFQYSEDRCFCLLTESVLQIHSLSSDFECLKKIQLCFSDAPKVAQKCCMVSYSIPEGQRHHFNTIFSATQSGSNLVAITFDLHTVYACTINLSTEEIVPVNLYKCPTEIAGLQIKGINYPEIIIGLKTGTLIKISINNDLEPPQIVHLNAAILKFLAIKDMVLYTDGCSMWRADEVFTENPKFSQLFVKQVKDFTVYENVVTCVTYSSLIYKFTLETSKSKSEYLPVELLSDSGLVQKIMDEIETNDRIVRKLKTELNYVSALALSNREELRNQIVEYNVTVHECYKDVKTKVLLTNELHEYFEANTIIFQIELRPSKQWKVTEVLNSLLGKLRLHVSVLHENKILKTTSVLLKGVINETNVLIPLLNGNYSEVSIDLVLMADIPGGLDMETELSIVLSKKNIEISSENFIKTFEDNISRNTSISIDDLVLVSAKSHHEDLFEFCRTPKLSTNEYNFYLNLPENFTEKLKTYEVLVKYLNENQAIFLSKKVSDEFLSGKNKGSFSLQIGDSKVKISKGFNDYSQHVMKITGDDVKIAYNMRCFFARILWDGYENCEEGKMLVCKTQHSLLQDMERSLKTSIASNSYNQENISRISNSFHSDVVSSLPL